MFEVAVGDVEALATGIFWRIEAAELRVPLAVQAGTGANWDEAH